MARVVEVSGTDVEDAVARALRELDLNRNQVDVDVVREGKRGFLGLGAEEAVVRVTAKGSAAESVAPAAGGRDEPRGDGEAPARTGEGRRRRGGRGGRGRGRGRGANGDASSAEGASDDRGRDRGGRGRDRDEGRERTPYTEVSEPTLVPGAPDDLPRAPTDDAEDEVDYAGRTLREVLTLLGLSETEISARDPETAGDGEGLTRQVFDIVGEDEETSDELGLLIGRRGETLQSLQYLLNVMVSGKYDGDNVFSLDIEQYRRRREQSLLEMAERVAEEVRDTGDVITLEPMSAAERRIVHLALEEQDGVSTQSVGQGSDRQIEVLPD